MNNLSLIYIANARFPNEKAHGVQIAKTCNSFIDKNINLELVLPKKHTKIKGNPYDYYGIKNKFPYKKIWSLNILPSTLLGFLFSSFIFGISSFLYILKNKSDAVYSIDLDHISFFLLPFLKKNYFFEMHAPKRNNCLNRFLFKKIKGVIAINDNVKNQLIENFPYLEDKIIVCPNGVDMNEGKNLDKTAVRQKLGIDADKKVIVYIGSFQYWKGIETIFEAAKNIPEVDFYFVGGLKEGLDWTENSDSLTNNIKFMGMRPRKEIPLWHAASDALINTGTKKDEYSYLYTSPMKLIEYLAAKRPIIASKTPAIEQVVSEEEAFFHEPDDYKDLIEKIRSVFENPTQGIVKSEKAYRKAAEYTWDSRADKILEFIHKKIEK